MIGPLFWNALRMRGAFLSFLTLCVIDKLGWASARGVLLIKTLTIGFTIDPEGVIERGTIHFLRKKGNPTLRQARKIEI